MLYEPSILLHYSFGFKLLHQHSYTITDWLITESYTHRIKLETVQVFILVLGGVWNGLEEVIKLRREGVWGGI